MTDGAFLLACLRAQGIQASERDGKLILSPGGQLDAADDAVVRQHKAAILEALAEEDRQEYLWTPVPDFRSVNAQQWEEHNAWAARRWEKLSKQAKRNNR